MIIIAYLNYYDGERKILPMEADSPKDAYEKVNNVISKYNKDKKDYYKWKDDIFWPASKEIFERLLYMKAKRKSFVSCEVNFEMAAKRLEFFDKLAEIDNEINKIEQERIDLFNSRLEPVQSDYANFKLDGIEPVSDYHFSTWDEWTREKVEIYDCL